MLEVEHSMDSIGCILTLEFDVGQLDYLLLTSKPVCKRIVRLSSELRRCSVSINQPGCTLRRFTLVGLSTAFAEARIKNRLNTRGLRYSLLEVNSTTLYSEYQALLHEALNFGTYVPAEPCQSANRAINSAQRGFAESSVLILHPIGIGADVALDESLFSAITVARDTGWNIQLRASPGFHPTVEDRSAGKRIFHMPLMDGAIYRRDVFHQMMSVVEEDTLLVYADHDCIDVNRARCSPQLKPEWNPELLLNKDYVQLPWMVSDSWIVQMEQVKGTVMDNPASVLLAAALGVRICSEIAVPALTDSQVIRIPMVLASLRAHEKKRAGQVVDSEQWRHELRQALAATQSDAVVINGASSDLSRVRWTLPIKLPTVDIIIPTRDKVSVLQACIDSILNKSTYSNYRIVVVDNDSEKPETENYYRSLAEESRISVLRYAGAFNYSAINNFAVSQSGADVIVLLNNDTEVISPDWLEELTGNAMRPEIGCIGAKLYYSNRRIQHAGVIVGITDVAGHAFRYSPGQARGYCDRLVVSQNMTAVTAACMAVRRTIYLEAGGLDEQQLRVAWNDVDFCLKVRDLGYRNLWTPHVELYHHEGLTRGADDTRDKIKRVDEERAVMMRRWGLAEFTDPAYHPLLTRTNESYSLGMNSHFQNKSSD